MNSNPTLNGHELELFRVGDYGAKGTYNAADMHDLVSRYSTIGEAPITIGHPEKDDEPAYGWVKGLRFSGDKLYGTPGDVTPELDKLVNEKKYKHRSVSFSRDKDGRLQLRHVAFLGAVPPHVKGLKPAHFSNEPYEVFVFSEGEVMDELQLKKSIGEGIVAFFSEKFGNKKDAPTVDADAIAAKITAKLEAKFAEELKVERDARLETEKKFEDHKKLFSAGGAKSRVDSVIVDLKTNGAWIPAYDKIGVSALFSALATSDAVVSFSDAAGVEVKLDQVDALAGVLKSVGKIVPRGHVFSAAEAQVEKPAPEANGAEVDPASATFSEMVQKFSDDNKVPYTEAYRKLAAQGKRPVSGSATSGAV